MSISVSPGRPLGAVWNDLGVEFASQIVVLRDLWLIGFLGGPPEHLLLMGFQVPGRPFGAVWDDLGIDFASTITVLRDL